MEKTELKIRVYPDPVLRKKSLPVKKVSAYHQGVLSQMARLMYEGEGVGLAAPQAGVNEMMIVVDAGSGLYKLINPKVTQAKGKQVNQEGCLSVPGICVKVRRAKKVRIEAVDEHGKQVAIEAEDLLACVLQHEIDHLKGKLIIDYASFIERVKIGRALKKLKAKTCQLNL